ncbi:MAG: ribonuclease H-like YkuK family protein [Caulobacteraceae bacterium]
MKSITYGEVSFDKMCKLIKRYILSDRDKEFNITVGTDSQNFDMTKIVVVVAVWKVGNGGIFFYDLKNVSKITNIRQKIFYETSLSLEMARRLAETLKNENIKCDIDIHVDAGDEGPSSKMIPEIVGWVKACGFECKTKPESYAASCIANKYSK